MSWERRVIDILLAGGALTTAACLTMGNDSVPCGNANGDPCICGRPEGSAEEAALCDYEKACQADGGTFELYSSDYLEDGGTPPPACLLGAPNSELDASADSAVDASSEDAPSADATGD